MVDVELELDPIGTLFVTCLDGRRSFAVYDGVGFFPLTEQERRYLRMGCRVLTSVDAGLVVEE